VSRSVRTPIETLQPYLLDIPPAPGRLPPDQAPRGPQTPIRWPDLFGNDRPVEIEVGFGKGMFLIQSCEARPETNFLGIEIERQYVLFAAARLAKLAPTNVRLACTDAMWFFANRVESASVAVVHVFFPDPWWKNRHKKRKLMTKDFASEIGRVLKPDGVFHFKTDVQEYFDQTMRILAVEPLLEHIPDSTFGLADAMTNFERKYRVEGRPIYRAIFRRRA